MLFRSRMIAKRKELPVLSKGKLDWMLETPKETLCFSRAEDNQRVFALHNLSNEPRSVAFADWESCVDAFDASAKPSANVTLPPHGYRWFVQKT